MKNEMDDYEKARRDTYAPLVERVPAERRKDLFIFTISCGLGWKKIVLNLAEELDKIWDGYKRKKGSDCWSLLQAKEKFGGLRFYVGYPEGEDAKARYEQSMKAIDQAETEAWKTCERCGKMGHTTSVGFRIATVCDSCEERWNERSKKSMTETHFG